MGRPRNVALHRSYLGPRSFRTWLVSHLAVENGSFVRSWRWTQFQQPRKNTSESNPLSFVSNIWMRKYFLQLLLSNICNLGRRGPSFHERKTEIGSFAMNMEPVESSRVEARRSEALIVPDFQDRDRECECVSWWGEASKQERTGKLRSIDHRYIHSTCSNWQASCLVCLLWAFWLFDRLFVEKKEWSLVEFCSRWLDFFSAGRAIQLTRSLVCRCCCFFPTEQAIQSI